MNQYLFSICCFLLSTNLWAQGWEASFGGSKNEDGHQIIQTHDDGFLIVGNTGSFVTGMMRDLFVIKVSPEGVEQKKIRWGTNLLDNLSAIVAMPDGNYLAAGKLATLPEASLVLAKINTAGDTLWTRKHFSGANNLEVHHMIALSTGGYMIIGALIQNGVSDFYLAKVDEQGNLLWQKIHEGNGVPRTGIDILEKDNQELIAIGHTLGTNQEGWLLHLDSGGDLLFDTIFSNANFYYPRKLVATADDGFLLVNNAPFSAGTGFHLAKFNADLNIEWQKIINEGLSQITASSACSTPDGGFLLTGWYQVATNSDGLAIKVDTNGDVQWLRTYGGIGNDYPQHLISTNDSGYAMIANSNSFTNDPAFQDIRLLKMDSAGFSLTNQIKGTIFFDTLENCEFDMGEISLEGWKVRMEGNDQLYFGLTDEFGNYLATVDTGDYLLQVIRPNAYWSPCETLQGVSFSNFHDTTTVDFAVQALYDCSILNVSLSTPFLRRCLPNIYYLNYCNEGTVTAENANIEVTFDEFLQIDSAEIAWINQIENTYTFPLGNIAVGDCHTIKIYTTLDCDSTILGQTHCVEAHIFPDSICLPPNTFWDGSSIEVKGECVEDSLIFTIKNVGTGNMSMLQNFIVIEDHIIHRTGNFQLSAGDSLEIKEEATGATYRLEADQAPFHPSGTVTTSATVEGCNGSSATFSIGFVNQYSPNDDSPFTDIDCQESIGSWDPNDKQAFPKGIGNQHLIDANTSIEYKIRFQNTGTDTAFRVVIRDTLSPLLDPATIQAGTSSHPYTWEILNGSVLKFSFEDILLPDSNVNEPASHGFIRFKIAQQTNNLPESIIENSAGIYFDFNAPVITNTTFHTIAIPVNLATENISLCEGEMVAGISIHQDTTLVDTLHFASFDSVILTNLQMLPTFETTFDTLLALGNIFNGVEIAQDTTWLFSETSSQGCDSLIVVQIHLTSHTLKENNLPIFDVQIHPNPTTDNLWIQFNGKPVIAKSLHLYNFLGRPLQTWHLDANTLSTLLKVQDLASGSYFLEIRYNGQSKWIKFLKK